MEREEGRRAGAEVTNPQRGESFTDVCGAAIDRRLEKESAAAVATMADSSVEAVS